VLVDARNVLRSRWPNLEPDWFLGRTRAWAEGEGVRARVVFDGRALAGEGRPAWLVSSDRNLRARVASAVERTIGGGTFAGLLGRLD